MSGTNQTKASQKDEEISLEDLVRADAGSSSEDGNPPSSVDEDSTDALDMEGEGDPNSLAELDALLASEDPGFAASLNELVDGGLSGDVDIDSIDLDEFLDEEEGWSLRRALRRIKLGVLKPWQWVRSLFNGGFGQILHLGTRLREFSRYMAKEGARNAVGSLLELSRNSAAIGRRQSQRFKSLSRTTQLVWAGVLVLSLALSFVVRASFQGRLLPALQSPFLASFESVADTVYTFDPLDGMEDFNSPLRHPEYVVLLDKIVVNLRPGREDNGNPMGMFELYIEASSRETAIEVADRMKEVLDAAQRATETISYDELITVTGKNKLKAVLRRDLNNILSKGRIRRVYFKSIVIKP